MVKIYKVDEENVMLELRPTKYSQLWNIWDLYEHLQNGGNKMTFEVEDFPIPLDKMYEYITELKQNNK